MPKKPGALLDALNEAISAELMAVTQYMWHHVMASGLSAPAVSEEFKKASIDEMKHAEHLAERLNYLGGVPTTKPKPIKVGGDLKKMLKDNLSAEYTAIAMYKRFIKMCGDDSTTRRLFEEILAEEEDHADQWETLLDIQK
ncbi:MAG TPA: ferritin-like domain-containing protein [bacterium]|jgi:bacterioferritin